MSRALLLCTAVVASAGCVGQAGTVERDATPIESPAVHQPPVLPLGRPIAGLTRTESELYLQRLAPMIVLRVLTTGERTRLQLEGEAAISPILESWTKEPAFAGAARLFIETTLNVSGAKDGVDYSLPGNLAAFLAANGRPWKELVTSETCYARDGTPTACDSDAPFKGGGLLTTRAYLKSRSSRFNLTRASTMLRTFACRAYPMEDQLQPRAAKAELLGMFQAQSAAEAEAADPRSVSGAANGAACYTCHGQFAHHAQLFVKYDSEGHYVASADGVQDPAGELGRSLNDTMASHFAPGRAASEEAQVFSVKVNNLAEAGAALANNPTYVECAAEFFLNWSLGLQWGIIDYDRNLMKTIAARALQDGDPSLGRIVIELFSDALVMKSIARKEPAP